MANRPSFLTSCDGQSIMSTQAKQVGGRTIEISKADKVLYPDDGITKADLATYYQQVADTLTRYTRDRPLAAERFPDGIDGERVFQKNTPDHFPGWIRRVEVPKKDGGSTVHTACDDPATLVFLADQACITPHVWLSRTDLLEHPDRLIFDLDPADNDLDSLRTAAKQVRELLDQIGLVGFVMTTGSRGFHVLSPLRRDAHFDDVRDLAHGVAAELARRNPRTLTTEQRKKDRAGRIFLDYLRNAYAQTAVAPYAVRARANAPVATPLHWDELDETTPQQHTIHNTPDRLRNHGDPWSALGTHARSPRQPRENLTALAH